MISSSTTPLVLTHCVLLALLFPWPVPPLWPVAPSRWTSLFQKLPLLLHVLILDQEVLVGASILPLLRQLRRDQLHEAILQQQFVHRRGLWLFLKVFVHFQRLQAVMAK